MFLLSSSSQGLPSAPGPSPTQDPGLTGVSGVTPVEVYLKHPGAESGRADDLVF